jgi:hypothetical protein
MADDEAAKPRRTSKATTAAPKRATKKAPAAAKAGAAKAPAKKAAPAKAPVRKARARATPDPAAKKAPARKVAAKQAPPTLPEAEGRRASSLLKPRAKKAPPMRLAAEQTFDDDWERRAPEPVREDPAARIRGVLRAAARSIEGREQAQARGVAPVPPSPPQPPPPPPPPPAPPSPPQPPAARPADEPVTRVLVAPLEAEPADEQVDEVEEQAEVEGEAAWAAPDVMEDSAPPPPSPPPPPPPPVATEPPPWEPPSAKAADVRRGGAGTSLLAIVLSVLVPIVGAVVGLVLAGRARSRGAALAGVARVVAVLALVVWLVGGGVVAYAAFNDEGVDYSKLKVGDCFDSSATNEVRGVKVKPCAKPHNSEIFFLVTHPAGPREPYPGKDALVQFAADACLGQPLTDYLGVPLEQSKLKDFEIVPQESAWKDGRRMLVCGVDTGGQGNLTGSVKGTRR